MWKAIFSAPLALLSVALSNPYNPFPAKRLSGEKCTSWTSAIDLGLVKEIKTKTGKFSRPVVECDNVMLCDICLSGKVKTLTKLSYS